MNDDLKSMTTEQLENEVTQRLPHVEVLTHLEPLEDPKSWDDPDKPLPGS